MEEKARQKFILKLYMQGFLLEELDGNLILRPKGYVEPAELIISEVSPGQWQVTGASGAYSRYYRGKHRRWFEMLVNQLAFQATQEVLG
ncbi:hypothetical protein ES705_31655 [subsurface metagenome]